MIKAILFDFDGTLVNSAPGIVKTMEQTYRTLGMPIPSEADMIATIGLPLRQALQLLNKLSDADADLATDTYRKLFPQFEMQYVTLFPQVVNTLEQLKEKGIRLAIVTSRDTSSLRLITRHRDLDGFFETCVTGADGIAPKPAPDMVLTLLERMQLKADEVLVVGDTTFDIEMGNRAHCRTIAVTYGNHTPEKLATAHPARMIDGFEQLLEEI
ncbi:MAG: HAD family hydrolase [Bacteroidales bacterium]|nr:HAD family hydrolase [Bacteroidales bacterium]